MELKLQDLSYAETLNELIEMFHNINDKVAINQLSSSGKAKAYAYSFRSWKSLDFALMAWEVKKKSNWRVYQFDYEITLLTILDSEGKFIFVLP